jgi:hypothetical protein
MMIDEHKWSVCNTILPIFSIIQHNCRGSNLVLIPLFQMLKTYNVSFICIQDPPLFTGKPLRASSGFECIASNTKEDKIRVVTYINLNLVSFISYSSLNPELNNLKL